MPEGIAAGGQEGATISAWLYEDGALVAAGSVIAQLVVAKADFDLEASYSGILRILATAETTQVYSGDVVATIIPGDERR